MNAIVHIGTEKTGTTSLQALLANNRERLQRCGYHFLQCAGPYNNRALPSYCMRLGRTDDFFRGRMIDDEAGQARFRDSFRGEFAAEIDNLPAAVHTVLISSEHFHSRLVHEDEIERLKVLLDEHFAASRILVYLRNQADTAVSLYSTAIKAGHTPEFDQFLESCTEASNYFNYDSFLSRWEGVFGREAIQASIFDPGEFHNGNLLEDFLQRIDPVLTSQLDMAVDAKNESLSYLGQQVGKAVNLAFPGYVEGVGMNPLRRRLIELTQQQFRGRGESIDAAHRAVIEQRFIQSNERVRARYFPQRTSLFPLAADRDFDDSIGADFPSSLKVLFEAITAEGTVVPHRYTNIFRDVAVAIENEHLEWAYELMKLAHQIRPEGPFIARKVEEYRRKLDRRK